MTAVAQQPVRFPNAGNPALMTRRAWWLVVLNLLIPGSAQVVAGNRRLGRIGLTATLVLWGAVVAAALLALLWRDGLLMLSTNTIALTVVQVALLFYAVLWVVLTIDVLRLVRIVRVAPGARPAVALVAVFALVITAGGAAYGASLVSATRGLLNDSFAGGEVRQPVDGRYNILLLGGDAGPDRVGLRPDSISVVSVDAATGQTSMIGIPRGQEFVPFSKGSPMYGPFPKGYSCGDGCLINYLYTYGEEHPSLYPNAVADHSSPGIEATKDAVEGVLGIPIQYYVIVDMQGFVDLIDAMGGIQITSDGRYPIGGGIDKNGNPTGVHAWVEPGPQRMDGNTALWYARSRHGTDDFNRMGRQRQVEDAMLQQMSPQTLLTHFQDIAKAGGQVVHTDIPQGALPGFIDLAEKAKSQQVAQLELVPGSGYHPGDPDYAKIHADVQALLWPKGKPTSSASGG